ncbi:hypothetical protein K431DRAFT_282803 [Polychaeton citri CBS 116435]|uniref:SigF-like NTF2-like domain-containing protein n=1 Tax=Polychaeton citri CBS 116435 TaxID=1314669 RepID=A0A9P4QCJ9_9PEZI|nr:hypothetical protein K431DRAFT_282803 [Polychaeton citri CBS 116435]
MENPVKEIPSIIRNLTETCPSEQEATIDTYFTRNAAFVHPFCRTGSFNTPYVNSRDLIKAIYRWYKILSPRIKLEVHDVAYSSKSDTLYVSISQDFRIWLVPFYTAPVSLTTVLQLEQSPETGKYLIREQNDLYQVDQFVRFVLPWGIGVFGVLLWHFWATAACVLGAIIFAPLTWLEESQAKKRGAVNGDQNGEGEDDVKRLMGFGSEGGRKKG